MRKSILTLLAILAMLRSEHGRAASVTTTADNGPGSLRQAIASATPGETLTFAVTGVITLTSGELLITTNLIITGPGAGQLSVQRSTAAGTSDFRIFNIRSGTVTISGLTVTNGRSDVGGGVFNRSGADLRMHDLVISGNSATNAGGGIKNVGTLTLDRCIITGNSAIGGQAGRSGIGGGIDNDADMAVSNSRIENNRAVGGANADGIGGGINNNANLTNINCTLTGNRAEGSSAGGHGAGGGINNGRGTVANVNCTISGNSALGGAGSNGGGARGGGIANDHGDILLDQCTVSGNSASGGAGTAGTGGSSDGGGIANGDGTVTLENSTVSGNSATPGKGTPAPDAVASSGLFNDTGTTRLSHSTVTANTAGEGSLQPSCAAFNNFGSLQLTNTILAGNTASFDLFSVESPAEPTGGFNLIGRTNVLISPGPKDRFNLTGAELKLGPLQDNGGPTFTHALLCGSPAIDAGDNTDAPKTDQRGSPRIVNDVIDIGAYEDHNTTPTILCPSPTTLEADASGSLKATVSVQVADADGDGLVVVWSVDGTASQTNKVAAGVPGTKANVSFTTSFGLGSHSIQVRVTDTQQCAATCSTTLLILKANRPPVALNDSYTLQENAVLVVPASGVLSNDTDADGDTLTAVLLSGPTHAANLTLNPNGGFSYTPAANYVGPDSFTYRANDGRANSAPATVSLTVTPEPGQGCDLYPIALHEKSLAGVSVGGVINDIYNGAQPGNFGWLTWAGSPSEPTLARSLTAPGNSGTYINPNAPKDHTVSVGDWVQGKPGVSNSKHVRDALDALKRIDITVPVWNQARGTGNNSLYRVVAFARVRIISYQLPRDNRISARFLGFVTCK